MIGRWRDILRFNRSFNFYNRECQRISSLFSVSTIIIIVCLIFVTAWAGPIMVLPMLLLVLVAAHLDSLTVVTLYYYVWHDAGCPTHPMRLGCGLERIMRLL